VASEIIVSKFRALFESVWRTALVVGGAELLNQVRQLVANDDPFSILSIGWGKIAFAAVFAAVLRAVVPLITDAASVGVEGVKPKVS
jgi:hypothetical protein